MSLPTVGCWNEMSLNVPSNPNPNRPGILWHTDVLCGGLMVSMEMEVSLLHPLWQHLRGVRV